MPRETIYVELECEHDTVLTQGEEFRFKNNPDEPIRCAWCLVDRKVTNVKIRTFAGPVCVLCFNGRCVDCVQLDPRWTQKQIGQVCSCHQQGHGDDFLMLVWAMSNPPISPDDATVKTGIILAASVEDRVRAAETIKEKASA